MPTFDKQYISLYTSKQLFDLVADITKYPEFLPWCTGARIIKQTGNILEAELIISFKGFNEKYTSLVTLLPPTDDNIGEIQVKLVSGPFKTLHNNWQFIKQNDNSTLVNFHIDFSFRSKIIEKLIGYMFEDASKKMTLAFENRAKDIYSSPFIL